MTFTEYKTVEKEVLDCLQSSELRWRYEPGDDVTVKYRGGDEQEMLLIPDPAAEAQGPEPRRGHV